MKQVLQSYRSGELWLAEVEPPGAARGGVRVDNRASLLSAGTERVTMALAQKSLLGKARARPDLVRRVLQKLQREGFKSTFQQVKDKLNAPIPMGYSCAGVVLDADVDSGLRPGMRVACAGAGYASHSEMVWVPRNLVVPMPDGLTFDQASFATVGAIALQGVRQSDVRLGDRVVVIGLGLLGLITVQLARASGASVYGTDLSQARVDLAKTLGATAGHTDPDVIAEEVAAWTSGHGADTVIITASAPGQSGPMHQAVELARLRGRVVVVGDIDTHVPRNEAYLKELEVRLSMSYGPGRYDPTYEEGGHDYPYAHVRWTEQRNLSAFLEAVADGRVDVDTLITHRFAIDDALNAYQLLEASSPYLGIVLRYGAYATESLAEDSAPAEPSQASLGATHSRPGVGVLGAGNYLRGVLLPKLPQTVSRELVVNRTGASGAQVAEAMGFRRSSTSVDELWQDDSVHAVIIGTRHDLHATQVISALEAGKHVFVEKPLCLNEQQLHLVATAQTQAGRYVQVGTNRRFSPYTTAVQELFHGRRDPLTLTVRINAGRIPASHWLRDPEVGGGRLVGEGIHWIDWAHAVVGRPVTRVHAAAVGAGGASNPGDSFVLTLSFADGSVATITYAADGDRGMEKERCEVFGAGTCVVIEDWSKGVVHQRGKTRALKTPRGQLKGTQEQLTAFFQTLRDGRPAVPMDVTLHVHHAAFQARKSLRDEQVYPVQWPRPAPTQESA